MASQEPLMTRKEFIETFGEDPVDMGIPTSDPENDKEPKWHAEEYDKDASEYRRELGRVDGREQIWQ